MSVVVMSVAASCYYGFSIIFPQMVFGLYTSDTQWGSLLACAGPACFILGMALSGLGRYIGKQKWQIVACSVVATPLLGGIACVTVDNRTTVLGLLILGATAIGYIEGLSLATSGIAIENQEEIGTAVGVATTLRSAWSTVATTVYIVVLQNRLSEAVPEIVSRVVPKLIKLWHGADDSTQVVPAITEAGLPASSVASYLAAIASGSFASVVGITPTVIEAGTAAYQQALVFAFRGVFYTAIAFLIVNTLAAFLFPNLDDKMTNEVAVRLRDVKGGGVTEK